MGFGDRSTAFRLSQAIQRLEVERLFMSKLRGIAMAKNLDVLAALGRIAHVCHFVTNHTGKRRSNQLLSGGHRRPLLWRGPEFPITVSVRS